MRYSSAARHKPVPGVISFGQSEAGASAEGNAQGEGRWQNGVPRSRRFVWQCPVLRFYAAWHGEKRKCSSKRRRCGFSTRRSRNFVKARRLLAPRFFLQTPRSEEHTSELQSLTNLVC